MMKIISQGLRLVLIKAKPLWVQLLSAVRGRDNVEGDDPTGLDAVAIKDEKTKTHPYNLPGLKREVCLTAKIERGNDWPDVGQAYRYLSGAGATPQLERQQRLMKKVIG